MYLEMTQKKLNSAKDIQNWLPKKSNGEFRKVAGSKGLYVRGQPSSSKAFYFRKRENWFHLASTEVLKLHEARRLASEVAVQLDRGNSPEALRYALPKSFGDAEKLEDQLRTFKAGGEAEQNLTFDELAQRWLARKEPTLADGPSRRRPRSLYEVHFKERFGDRLIKDIGRSELLAFFETKFDQQYETASRLMALVSTIMLQAKSKGLIDYDPLPSRAEIIAKKPATKHHRTIDYQELPNLWKAVEASNAHGVTKALILTGMVTALRFGSIQKVRGKHLDLQTGFWIIPAASSPDDEYRMKSGQEFVLNLPPDLLEKFRCLLSDKGREKQTTDFLFSSPYRCSSPVSETAVRKCLKATNHDVAFHGFRNAIKIWGKNNGFDRDLMDAYCQHGLKGLDRAYRREDTLEARYEVTKKLTAFVLGKAP